MDERWPLCIDVVMERKPESVSTEMSRYSVRVMRSYDYRYLDTRAGLYEKFSLRNLSIVSSPRDS